jgi:hypothetical protein
MKLTDPLVKRRVAVAGLFREVDVLQQGVIKTPLFRKVYDALLSQQYLNPKSKKHKYEELVRRFDPLNKGKIEMNAVVEWLDTVSATLFKGRVLVVRIIELMLLVVVVVQNVSPIPFNTSMSKYLVRVLTILLYSLDVSRQIGTLGRFVHTFLPPRTSPHNSSDVAADAMAQAAGSVASKLSDSSSPLTISTILQGRTTPAITVVQAANDRKNSRNSVDFRGMFSSVNERERSRSRSRERASSISADLDEYRTRSRTPSISQGPSPSPDIWTTATGAGDGPQRRRSGCSEVSTVEPVQRTSLSSPPPPLLPLLPEDEEEVTTNTALTDLSSALDPRDTAATATVATPTIKSGKSAKERLLARVSPSGRGPARLSGGATITSLSTADNHDTTQSSMSFNDSLQVPLSLKESSVVRASHDPSSSPLQLSDIVANRDVKTIVQSQQNDRKALSRSPLLRRKSIMRSTANVAERPTSVSLVTRSGLDNDDKGDQKSVLPQEEDVAEVVVTHPPSTDHGRKSAKDRLMSRVSIGGAGTSKQPVASAKSTNRTDGHPILSPSTSVTDVLQHSSPIVSVEGTEETFVAASTTTVPAATMVTATAAASTVVNPFVKRRLPPSKPAAPVSTEKASTKSTAAITTTSSISGVFPSLSSVFEPIAAVVRVPAAAPSVAATSTVAARDKVPVRERPPPSATQQAVQHVASLRVVMEMRREASSTTPSKQTHREIVSTAHAGSDLLGRGNERTVEGTFTPSRSRPVCVFAQPISPPHSPPLSLSTTPRSSILSLGRVLPSSSSFPLPDDDDSDDNNNNISNNFNGEDLEESGFVPDTTLVDSQSFLRTVHEQLDAIMFGVVGDVRSRTPSVTSLQLLPTAAAIAPIPTERRLVETPTPSEFVLRPNSSSLSLSSAEDLRQQQLLTPKSVDRLVDTTAVHPPPSDLQPLDFSEILLQREQMLSTLSWLRRREQAALDTLHEAQIASQLRIQKVAQNTRQQAEADLRKLLVAQQLVEDKQLQREQELKQAASILSGRNVLLLQHALDHKQVIQEGILALRQQLVEMQRQQQELLPSFLSHAALMENDIQNLIHEKDQLRSMPTLFACPTPREVVPNWSNCDNNDHMNQEESDDTSLDDHDDYGSDDNSELQSVRRVVASSQFLTNRTISVLQNNDYVDEDERVDYYDSS